jgi:hypothetical protein
MKSRTGSAIWPVPFSPARVHKGLQRKAGFEACPRPWPRPRRVVVCAAVTPGVSYRIFDEVVSVLNDNPKISPDVQGHTDNPGTASPVP